MDSRELEYYVSQDALLSSKFIGVFASNSIPKYLGGERCLIANTQPVGMVGAHWVALYRNGLDSEFFDSYGLDAISQKFLGNYIKHNRAVIQSVNSKVCGQLCIYYLFYRIRGYSLEEIVKSLTRQSSSAEDIVGDFFDQKFIK